MKKVILIVLHVNNNKNWEKLEKEPSPAGNRTPVSRVTGGDTYHYTTEDFTKIAKLNVEENQM